LLELVLPLLFLVFAMGLRLNLEKHHVERALYLLGHAEPLIGQSFRDITHQGAMHIIFKMRITHFFKNSKRILNPSLA